MLWAKQSTAKTCIIGPILDSTGAEYGSAVIGDLDITKNGATAAMAASATLTLISNGRYTLVFTTGNTDTLGAAQITCNKVTYQMPCLELMIVPATVYDAIVTNATTAVGGLGDIQRIAGTAQTGRDIGLSVLLAASQHVIVDSGTVTTLTNLPAAPTDWLTAAAVKADAVTKIQSGLSTYAGGDTSGVTTLLSRIGGTITITSGGVLVHSVDTDGIVSASFAAGTTVPRVTLVDTTTANTDMLTAAQVRGAVGLGAANLDTQLNAIYTVAGLVQAKTDNLSGDPADASDIAGAFTTLTGVLNSKIPNNIAMTGSRVWALDGSGNAIPTAANNATATLGAGDVDGFTLEETLKLCLSALAGKLSGGGTTAITIRAADDSKNRIVATVDASENRTALTLDATG